jgi:hypothetical protein
MLPPDIPEFRNVKGRFNVQGTSEEFSISEVRMTAEGPDGLAATVAGEGAKFSLATGVTEIALSASFAVPSSQTFAQMLPPEAPELRNVTGRFDVQGTLETLSVSDVRLTAEGADGLAVKVTGQVAEISLATGFAAKDLALDLDARWPDTKGVYRLVGQDLPDFGPVRGRATIRDRGETFALTGVNVTAGSPDQPAIRVTGEIGDLLSFKGFKLLGVFDVPTAVLLGTQIVAPDVGLGTIRGQFGILDADGSVGIEALTAELKNSELLSLAVTGRFDDLEQVDELRFEASLAVPNVSELGRAFGFEVERLGSLSFTGEVSGSGERFRADGKARLGETELTGTVSGTLEGERPALQAKLRSPVLRLADFGLVPDIDTPESTVTTVTENPLRDRPVRRFLFRQEPIPFSSLKGFDLDLDVQLDEVEGIRLDIDTAEIQLTLEDGLLKIDPLLFNFAGGRIEIGLVVDARTEPPAVVLDIIADDVDMGDFLAQVDVEVPLDGELDMVLDLEASGVSPRALASSFGFDGDEPAAVDALAISPPGLFRAELSRCALRFSGRIGDNRQIAARHEQCPCRGGRRHRL